MAITTDLWSSRAQQSYVGLTIHFVDKDWHIENRFLDCFELPDQHAVVDIGEAIDKLLTFWNLRSVSESRVIAATSDNGRNIVNALSIDLEIPYTVGCVAHTLNLAVEKGLKSEHVSPLMAKTRRLVEHFDKSPKAAYKLRQAQIEIMNRKETEVLAIVQDVPTRWTSAYYMLDRILEIMPAVDHVLSKSSKSAVRQLALSAENKHQLSALSTVLKPLCLVEQAMGGDSYCSLPLMDITLHRIKTVHLAAQRTDD